MDSIRISWNADHDSYVLHVPGQKDMVLLVKELSEIKDAIQSIFDSF